MKKMKWIMAGVMLLVAAATMVWRFGKRICSR